MSAYYNEFEPFTAAWLGNLVEAGHVARGRVDSRSIKEVTGDDVREATQAHFFAGIGVWSHALRLAGWPDDVPVWTGSCPCQPFSVAGRRKGADDERHLWPEWRRLIATCKPPVVFGEQVASADGRAWLDQARFDLEHIEFWSDYYEGLHELLAAKTVEQLSSLLGALLGRTATRLCRLPASVRGSVESEEQGATRKGSSGQGGEGERLQKGVRRRESRSSPGNGGSPTKQAQGAALRLAEFFAGTGGTGPARTVRDDGIAFRLSQQDSELEQSVSASGQSLPGVCLPEHSSHLLRDECGPWQLGGGPSRAACRSVVTEGCLNDERRIAEAFGSLLASADGRAWLDAVRADMEALGYAVGAADLCAAGVGAPHIRQRLYFGAVRLADTERDERRQVGEDGRRRGEGGRAQGMDERPLHGRAWRDARGLADTGEGRRGRGSNLAGHECDGAHLGRPEGVGVSESRRFDGGLADTNAAGRVELGRRGLREDSHAPHGHDADGRGAARGLGDTGRARAGRNTGAGPRAQEGAPVRAVGDAPLAPGAVGQRLGDTKRSRLEGHTGHGDDGNEPRRDGTQPYGPTPTSGFWGGPDWVYCRDDKYRPVEPGSFPLARGAPQRVGRLRAYGNAIVAEVAATFIRAVMDVLTA